MAMNGEGGGCVSEKTFVDQTRISDGLAIDRLEGLTNSLSYNDMVGGSNPKSLIRDLCRRFDTKLVTIVKKTDGYLMRDRRGQTQYLSFKDGLIWRFLGRPPAGRIVVPENATKEHVYLDADEE